jgi:hypothetical protein
MNIQQWSLLLGVVLLVKGLFTLAAREPATRMTRAFSRHVWAGRVLSTLAWIWAGWALYSMPLELLVPIRKAIPLLTLAAIPLTWYWMPELLSCRALGGLMTLFPHPLLLAVRAHPSAWRLTLVILAYTSIVAGMTLILYPYYLRRALDWFAARPERMRLCGTASLLLGALLAALGFTVFAG